MQRSHRPIRLCVGCGQRELQTHLIRFRVTGEGALELANGKPIGRSGYLHPASECCQRFSTRKGPVRSLRRSFDREARASLVNQMRELLATRVESR